MLRLASKTFLMLVADGVEESEYEQLRQAFAAEGAQLLTTALGQYLTVESVRASRRGRDIAVDVPFEGVEVTHFDALLIPGGFLAVSSMVEESRILDLIYQFYLDSKPIFASDQASVLLYRSHVLSEQVLVREGTAVDSFVDRAVGAFIKLDPVSPYQAGSAASAGVEP